MIIFKHFVLISFIVSLLLVVACTAESGPPVAGEATTAAATIEPTPTTEPTLTPETVITLEPTATVVEEVAETAVPTETAVAEDSKPLFNDLPVQGEQPAPVGLLYSPVEGGIWQIGTDGQPQQLTAQQDAVPSPDGRHAIFQVQGDLWLLEIATGEMRALTRDHDDQGTHLAGFHWWYNNETILSGIWLDFESDGGPNVGRPALIDIATGEVTMVDSQHLMSSYPAISASGAIAYSTGQQSANDTKTAWIYLPDTGVTVFDKVISAAPEGSYSAPAWSKDGRFLAWLVSDGVNVQLVVFGWENQTVKTLPTFSGAAFGGPYPNPIFSEDSNWIALRQFTDTVENDGLWLYDRYGRPPLFIAQNGGESLWVNDHLLLFIDYDENYNGQLQQYDALTGVRSVVTLPDVVQIFGIVE